MRDHERMGLYKGGACNWFHYLQTVYGFALTEDKKLIRVAVCFDGAFGQ